MAVPRDQGRTARIDSTLKKDGDEGPGGGNQGDRDEPEDRGRVDRPERAGQQQADASHAEEDAEPDPKRPARGVNARSEAVAGPQATESCRDALNQCRLGPRTSDCSECPPAECGASVRGVYPRVL